MNLTLCKIIVSSLLLLVVTVLAVLVVGLGILSPPTTLSAATPDVEGQPVFEQKCKACHTIGGGRSIGPDLKEITAKRERDWLSRFIASPDRLIAQGDSLAKQLVQEYGLPMPNMGLSVKEVGDILAYLETRTGSVPAAASTGQTTGVSAQPVIPGSAQAGRDIFRGETPLQKGGPACLSCHNVSGIGLVGGGTFAKDLTASYATLGVSSLTGILKTAPLPVMQEIYTAKPLTDDEIASLVAFLQETDSRRQEQPAQNPLVFFLGGAAGFLVVIVSFQFIWRGRLSGMRQPLVNGGSR